MTLTLYKSQAEVALLKLVEKYGAEMDLSGPRIGRTVKTLARELLASGHLAGKLKSLALTDKGRALLKSSS